MISVIIIVQIIIRTEEVVSRLGKKTEKNLEYICDSYSHCGWSIRSSVPFKREADQAKNRQERNLKSEICCIFLT